ncbi:MAG: methyltransferase, partial [bacterium]|nr:methyltransferase [bacterium]
MTNQEWNPGKLLELSGGYWQTCALHAAVKLDLFSTLGDETLRGEDLAQRLAGDTRGVSMLLNALTAMALLSKSNNKYRNTPAAKSYLSKTSDQYVGYMIMHHHNLVEGWNRLDEAVLSGRPVRQRAHQDLENFIEHFLMGMFTLARNLAPKIVDIVDLSKRNRLLDLGGGPGTYAIHFCLKNPKLKATVFDLPTSRSFAEKTVQKFNVADRIDFLEGNYLTDTLSGSYDVAWLSHILHGEGPEDCQRIIEKADSVLKPGGLIIIHEINLNNSLDEPQLHYILSSNIHFGNS